jgi:hypothetical protein
MIYLFHLKHYLLDVDCVSWFIMRVEMWIVTCALYVYSLFCCEIWPATLINSHLLAEIVWYLVLSLEYTIRYSLPLILLFANTDICLDTSILAKSIMGRREYWIFHVAQCLLCHCLVLHCWLLDLLSFHDFFVRYCVHSQYFTSQDYYFFLNVVRDTMLNSEFQTDASCSY